MQFMKWTEKYAHANLISHHLEIEIFIGVIWNAQITYRASHKNLLMSICVVLPAYAAHVSHTLDSFCCEAFHSTV